MLDHQEHAQDAKTELKRADGIAPPTSLGDLITADHTILNLDDESRDGQRDALIRARWIGGWERTPAQPGSRVPCSCPRRACRACEAVCAEMSSRVGGP